MGTDIVVMAEVMEEGSYVPHHPKKIALIFAAMRKFSARLRDDGWDVRYTRLDDPDNSGSIVGELLRRADETGAKEVIATEPDNRLIRHADGSLDARLIQGSAMSIDCWREANAEAIDVLIAVTDNDAVNMLAAMIAA